MSCIAQYVYSVSSWMLISPARSVVPLTWAMAGWSLALLTQGIEAQTDAANFKLVELDIRKDLA